MMTIAARPETALRGRLATDVPLARRTSWRCGGRAERAYTPADRLDLAAFVRGLPATEPVTALGLGSNVLVRDGGVRGTVILVHAALAVLEFREGLIYAEAGVASPKLSRYAAMHDRGEAEFLSGIPGTVGGALAMNAGCYGGETWRYVVQVEVLNRAGTFSRLLPSDFSIDYRSVRRADVHAPPGLFTAAWFGFPPGARDVARGRIRQLLERRIATQPLGLPNAGSVFRNPPGDNAARLIESCGLKGCAIGGAHVSEKHANFIVNPRGQGSATDIEALIDHVRAVVRERTGIDLVREIEIIGERAA